jgi:hypothetical protein
VLAHLEIHGLVPLSPCDYPSPRYSVMPRSQFHPGTSRCVRCTHAVDIPGTIRPVAPVPPHTSHTSPRLWHRSGLYEAECYSSQGLGSSLKSTSTSSRTRLYRARLYQHGASSRQVFRSPIQPVVCTTDASLPPVTSIIRPRILEPASSSPGTHLENASHER